MSYLEIQNPMTWLLDNPPFLPQQELVTVRTDQLWKMSIRRSIKCSLFISLALHCSSCSMQYAVHILVNTIIMSPLRGWCTPPVLSPIYTSITTDICPLIIPSTATHAIRAMIHTLTKWPFNDALLFARGRILLNLAVGFWMLASKNSGLKYVIKICKVCM